MKKSIKKVLLILAAICVCIPFAGCKKGEMTVEEYTVKANEFYTKVQEYDQAINAIDPKKGDACKEMLKQLDGLDKDARDKISKIILIDDVHAASAWRHLKDFISVPVEYKLTERVIDNKSLVDMTLAVQACRDCFVNAVDAFLLVSSDSDFWALISALPEADFVVLVEHEKCSYDLKTKLLEQGICYAYIDDFYSANSTRIMEGVLKAEIQEELDKMVSFNMREIMVEKMKKGQMYMSENEKSAFYGKYLQSAKLVIDDEGNAKIEIKK